MTRNFFTDKRKALSGYKARLSGASLSAMALMGVAGPATAQEVGLESLPDGYQLASDLNDFESIKILADGSVEITLSTGETVSLAASDVSVIGGEVFVAEAAAEAAGLSLRQFWLAGPSRFRHQVTAMMRQFSQYRLVFQPPKTKALLSLPRHLIRMGTS